MSFADNVDLESQVPYSDSPEFDLLSETVSSGLFELNSKLATLHSHLKALSRTHSKTNGNKNGSYSSTSIEERAVALADDIRYGFKHLGDSVKEIQGWQDTVAAQRFTQNKLSREFSVALTEFQDLQRQLAEQQRLSVTRAKEEQQQRQQKQHHLLDEEDEEETEGNSELLQAQEQQQLLNQHELDYQQTLIQEREAEIQGIEHGIEELNEIFTDLGAIVNEQGTIVGEYFQANGDYSPLLLFY